MTLSPSTLPCSLSCGHTDPPAPPSTGHVCYSCRAFILAVSPTLKIHPFSRLFSSHHSDLEMGPYTQAGSSIEAYTRQNIGTEMQKTASFEWLDLT